MGSGPITARQEIESESHAVNFKAVCLDLDLSHSLVGSVHLDPV